MNFVKMYFDTIRESKEYNAFLMIIGCLIGLYCSFVLSVDSLILAKTPSKVLNCDINSRISCSGVSKSHYAAFIPFNGVNVPNAFFGMVIFAGLIGVLLSFLFNKDVSKILFGILTLGVLACFIFTAFLLTVSMFILHVLCPYCLAMDCGVILIIIGFVRFYVFEFFDKMHSITFNFNGWIMFLIETIPFLLIILLIIMNIPNA